jgi:hypothetical protein
MPEMKKVLYRGRELGEVAVYHVEDWRNTTRPAGEKDLRLINATSAADSLQRILTVEPKQCDELEPDQPWLTVALREVCTASSGERDMKLEEMALLLYVERHGMNQILSIWGADIGKLAEELEKLRDEEDNPLQ